MWGFDEERDPKRTLGIRDKQILWERANHKCENPKCKYHKIEISFVEMMPGHKKAWANGGRTTLANSVCLCFKCNKLQGKDSWEVFLKKQGWIDPKVKVKVKVKEILETYTIAQLKLLASKHHIRLSSRTVDGGWFEGTHTVAPTKSQYITKLAGVVTEQELKSPPKPTAPPKKKPRRRAEPLW
jgi:hypothetical protein